MSLSTKQKIYQAMRLSTYNIGASEKEKAIKSARRGSSFGGKKSLVPNYVKTIVRSGDSVLNFGAGVKEKDGKYLHSEIIREAGGVVDECDLRWEPAWKELLYFYDIVFASNVINVQPSLRMLLQTLLEIKSYVKRCSGVVVMNYPKSPRYLNISTEEMRLYVSEIFNQTPKVVAGGKNSPVWEIRYNVK